jgi:hypothetical protein
MSGFVAFLRCVGRAALANGGKAIASLVPGGEAAFELARDVCKEYRRDHGAMEERPLTPRVGCEEGIELEEVVAPPRPLPTRAAGVGERSVISLPDLELATSTGTQGEVRPPITVRGSQHTYRLQRLLAAGETADVHLAGASGDSTVGPPSSFVVKVSREPEADVFLENEQQTLAWLCRTAAGTTYRNYLPTLVESFRAEGPHGKRVNVFLHEPGYWTLEQVHQLHPALDGRHLAWIFKRLLTVLGFCHREGRVHGAVLPGHVLIHSGNHGIQLVGWGQSVPVGRAVTNVSTRWRDWFPPEVRHRQPATAATDLFLAARCAIYLAGGDPLSGRMPDAVPVSMRRFVETCLFPAVSMRPGDAWKLLEEFDRLLHRLYGPPKFHPLAMN